MVKQQAQASTGRGQVLSILLATCCLCSISSRTIVGAEAKKDKSKGGNMVVMMGGGGGGGKGGGYGGGYGGGGYGGGGGMPIPMPIPMPMFCPPSYGRAGRNKGGGVKEKIVIIP